MEMELEPDRSAMDWLAVPVFTEMPLTVTVAPAVTTVGVTVIDAVELDTLEE
jgi:hypothetical protein